MPYPFEAFSLMTCPVRQKIGSTSHVEAQPKSTLRRSIPHGVPTHLHRLHPARRARDPRKQLARSVHRVRLRPDPRPVRSRAPLLRDHRHVVKGVPPGRLPAVGHRQGRGGGGALLAKCLPVKVRLFSLSCARNSSRSRSSSRLRSASFEVSLSLTQLRQFQGRASSSTQMSCATLGQLSHLVRSLWPALRQM